MSTSYRLPNLAEQFGGVALDKLSMERLFRRHRHHRHLQAIVASLRSGGSGSRGATIGRIWCSKGNIRITANRLKHWRLRGGSLVRRNQISLVSARTASTPRTDALARNMVLAIFLATDGRPLVACGMSSLPGVTAEVLLYAHRSRWLELRSVGVCLTPEGRRVAIQQAN